MRSRLPLILIALAMLVAFGVAGCGDDKSSEVESVPDLAAPAEPEGTTGSNGSATESAKTTLDSCLKSAEDISDADRSKALKKSCQDSYDSIKDSTARMDQATSNARAQCEAAAAKIQNEDAKSATLDACAKFK